MADRDSIYEWLSRRKYRVVHENDPARNIVKRLVAEGRAQWLGAGDRVRAVPRAGHDTEKGGGP